MVNNIKRIVEKSMNLKASLLSDDALIERISESVLAITAAFKEGKKVFFCGNGGSAADAQHLAAEFSGRFYKDRTPLPAEALHVNTSYLTAVGNDYGFEFVYSRLVEGAAGEGDVLIGLSTSGNSKNIVNAFKVAINKKVKVIAFTGVSGGEMKNYCNILLNVPSVDTPRIQEAHILIGHIICELVESDLF